MVGEPFYLQGYLENIVRELWWDENNCLGLQSVAPELHFYPLSSSYLNSMLFKVHLEIPSASREAKEIEIGWLMI